MNIDKLLSDHHRPILFLSAGKDSLACLVLLRGYLDRITVAWANPGAPHEEVIQYMDALSLTIPNFIELRGNQPESIAEYGWPADVVPIRATKPGENGAGVPDLRVQSYLQCCWQNMWKPMDDYVKLTKSTLVIMGQRNDELIRNRMRDKEVQVIGGVTYFQPINNWSSDDVFAFLKDSHVDLPPFYAQGAESSSDCWNCTAYLDKNQARITHLKREQPEKYAQIKPIFIKMAKQIADHNKALLDLVEVGL